jgi:hypothetical protein
MTRQSRNRPTGRLPGGGIPIRWPVLENVPRKLARAAGDAALRPEQTAFIFLISPTRAIVPFRMQCIDELVCLSCVQFSSFADSRISRNEARQKRVVDLVEFFPERNGVRHNLILTA